MMQHNNQKVKYILIVIVFLIVIALAVWLVDYFMVKKLVKLNPVNGSTITLINTNNDKEVVKTAKTKTIRVRSGDYLVRYDGGSDYQEVVKNITINSNTTLTTPALSYSTDKLNKVLKQSRSSINAVLSQDARFKDYVIEKEALFIKGEWYGARLIPIDWYKPNTEGYIPRPINENNTKDFVKIVMQNEGEQWKIVAGPVVVLNLEENKNIPEEVIRKANKLGF
jgi:hypothetical protein